MKKRDVSKAYSTLSLFLSGPLMGQYTKLGVNDRTQASVWAASRGLL